MFFGDGNPSTNYPFTTALDIVAHEYTHGVTDATSKLIYVNESGALNEAFSDIMGVELRVLPTAGRQRDICAPIGGRARTSRRTSGPAGVSPNPASVRIWDGYNDRYPDHYSKRWILPATANGDWGGVHLNSTIGSHWYYLLAHGGTNKTSRITVNGIGLSKAEQIAYRAWVHYFTPSTNYHNARTLRTRRPRPFRRRTARRPRPSCAAWTAVGVN